MEKKAMRVKIVTALFFAVIFTIGTYALSPLINLTNLTERGFPLPWAFEDTTWEWIPIFGPLLVMFSFSINIFTLLIDIMIWFVIIYVVVRLVGKTEEKAV